MRGIPYTLSLLLLLCLPCRHASAQTTDVADTIRTYLARESSDTGKVITLLGLARRYTSSDVAKEFYYANEALIVAQKAKWDAGIMRAELMVGGCYDHVKAYNDALQHFNTCLALSRSLGRPDVEANCLRLMLHSYHELNNMNEVLHCETQLVALAARGENRKTEYMEMRSMGIFQGEAGRYAEGVSWLHKALAFVNGLPDSKTKVSDKANMLNTLAGLLIRTSQTDSAIYYLREAETLCMQNNDDFMLSYVYSTFCDVYEATRQFDSAAIYGEKTVKMGEALHNIDLQQYYSKMLSKIYEEAHKPAAALVYRKRYDSLIAIIDNTDKTIAQAIQVARIDIQQQEERSRQEKRSLEAIKEKQSAGLTLAITALVAVIALAIFTYRGLKAKQKANIIISRQAESLRTQNEIIENTLKEKDDLLRELHHRVKNNLQLISSLLELQASGQTDGQITEALRAAQRRVLSIATVHSKLYGNNENTLVDLSAFTSDLYTRLSNALDQAERPVHFTNSMPSTPLPLNTVVLLGLILNELITNSFKHAFRETPDPAIDISLKHADSHYFLQYRDNGKGVPDQLFTNDQGTLGLQLIKRLARQLKGTADYGFDGGSIFTIIFPDAGS